MDMKSLPTWLRSLGAVFMRRQPKDAPHSCKMWATETCTVWVGIDEGGSLYFAGWERQGLFGESFDYDVILKGRDIPRVVAALGGKRGDDVVLLCVAHGEMIFRQGEEAWLESLGLKPQLMVWHD